MITLIAAMANQRVIGKDNQMPWHMPADLRHFKLATQGKPVIMGRKTYESIGRPLPQRTNIVITRNPKFSAAGVKVAHSLDEAIDLANEENPVEIMVIGGANIYEQAMPHATRMLLTWIDANVVGDTHFPRWDADAWHIVAREEYPADDKNAHPYAFVTLERI